MASPQKQQQSSVVPFKRPPTSHAFPKYEAPRSAGESFSATIPPEDLHKHLDVAPYVRLRFGSEKRLQSYRALLYKVNVQGRFRYATRREGWTNLIVLRLK